MTTKLNHSGSSITGFGYKQGVVPVALDAILERAQQNGQLSETVNKFCCQQKSTNNPEQVLVVEQPPVKKGEPTMTTAAQTEPTNKPPITAKDWVEKNFDATPYINGEIIPKNTAWSFYEQAKDDGLKVGFSTITVAIYAKRNKLMEEKQKETITPSSEHPADQKSPKVVTIDSLIKTTLNDKNRIDAQMEELLLQAQQLEQESRTKSEFIAFLENLKNMPDADKYLQQILTCAQA